MIVSSIAPGVMLGYLSAASLRAVKVPTVTTMHAPGKRASQGSVVMADCA